MLERSCQSDYTIVRARIFKFVIYHCNLSEWDQQRKAQPARTERTEPFLNSISYEQNNPTKYEPNEVEYMLKKKLMCIRIKYTL